MKALVYLIRFLYIFFVCYSASIVSVIAIFIGFDIDADELKPLYFILGFILHLVILDIFFLTKYKSKSFFFSSWTKSDTDNKEEHF